MNRGTFDGGWSCREHALITCCLLTAHGIEAWLIHGKVMYVRGPSGGLPPVGRGQELSSQAGHTWLDIPDIGVVDLSPNLAGGIHPHWPSVTFSGILGSEWLPYGGGQFVQCTSAQDYDNQIALGSYQENGMRAVYLPMLRERLTSGMIMDAFRYVNSPLTDSLRKRFDSSVYAKAVLHFADRLDGRGRSLAGVSRNKGWSIIASRAGNAIEEVLRMTHLHTGA
jgi:hypothetical protein